jgi:hypothetical protein
LIKYEGESNCYGFNADNYLFGNGFRLADRVFGLGEYVIKVSVKGDNIEDEATFLVKNSGNRHNDVRAIRKRGNY